MIKLAAFTHENESVHLSECLSEWCKCFTDDTTLTVLRMRFLVKQYKMVEVLAHN